MEREGERYVIFVVSKVLDAPNQVRFQRVVALCVEYNVIVVSHYGLPPALADQVYGEHVASGSVALWKTVLSVARRLRRAGSSFFIHTQYTPKSLISGFLCKVLLRCPWVYDVWDHPSLAWANEVGQGNLRRKVFWYGLAQRLVGFADVWVIAMHPGILARLPHPGRRCRLIFAQPGYTTQSAVPRPDREGGDDRVRICYAGKLVGRRGGDLLLRWAELYDGPPVILEIMGQYDEAALARVKALESNNARRACIEVRWHGVVSHEGVISVLDKGDIGICLTNPDVLNYRYAYPVKVVEYLSMGLVVVASDGHGVRSLITDGSNGFLSEYEGVSFAWEMGRAIDTCRDAGSRAHMSARAIASVEGMEWPAVNQRLVGDLNRVLEVRR